MRPSFFALFLLAASCVCPAKSASAAALRVPAFTAYLEPHAEGARVTQNNGLNGWNNPDVRAVWFGELKSSGQLQASVALRLPSNNVTKLRLTIAGQAHEAETAGQGTNEIRLGFGSYPIPSPGYQSFRLESLNARGQNAGTIEALLLDGPPTLDAHFNLKPRRNAASVHLRYPSLRGTNVSAFYCEATGVEEPTTTFYMACGWHRGYFGMQINSPTERRIIFSVWDSGNEAVSRARVADSNRVQLIAKGEGVYSGDFGNEGTGGHSHLKYRWKTGERQRFIVSAQPTNQTFTIFSGYWFHPEKQQWMLVSSWRAPKDGGWLKGMHSFSENFGGSNGQLRRKALFGNQWARTDAGQWVELTSAEFSHDSTGKSDRLDRFMGVEDGQFFLSHGGFIPGFSKAGEKFTRTPTSNPPKASALPPLP